MSTVIGEILVLRGGDTPFPLGRLQWMMIGPRTAPLGAEDVAKLDRFTKLNVLALLGQTLHEVRRGNEVRAGVLLGTTLVAMKYRKISFALQGVMVADRMAGRVTGQRPLRALVGGTEKR